MKIFLLCKNLPDHGQFEVVAWAHNREQVEGVAIARCWEAYYEDLEKPQVDGLKYLSPEETKYREFYVMEVSKLPPPLVKIVVQAGGMFQTHEVSPDLLDDAQAFVHYISEQTMQLAARAAKEKHE